MYIIVSKGSIIGSNYLANYIIFFANFFPNSGIYFTVWALKNSSKIIFKGILPVRDA